MAERDFGVYIHVPFCAARCGYCDCITYTAADRGGGASRAQFAAVAAREMAWARGALGQAGPGWPGLAGSGSAGAGGPGLGGAGGAGPSAGARPAATVFFGGGTPTLLPVADLALLLDAVRDLWGLAPGAEVTVEANPDSVTGQSVRELAAAGVTRLSIGMQSARPEVLATLGRTHRPAGVARAVGWAQDAGLEVSADLIYGAPGETMADWEASLRTAAGYGIGHISLYALTLEDGVPLARRIRRGELPPVDPEGQAAKYELADGLLAAEGFAWYELSKFARRPELASRHNLG
ncbi:MAG: radical SAM protein, partial [Bifidobacteriaceae bacterium]|nr:radical SAM protein [Bifidobacteriaceae bacterium]